MSTLDAIVNLARLEAEAMKVLDRQDSDYYNGGAEDERTLEANTTAFQGITIWPKMLARDVSNVDTSCMIPALGLKTSSPIMLAPVAMQKLAHPDGEAGAARAARDAGTAYSISQQATMTLEKVAAACGDAPRLFQLYVLRDRDIVHQLVMRAEKAGCFALAVTVDSPVLGRRERDITNRFQLKKGIELANFVKKAPTSAVTGESSSKGAQKQVAKRIGNRDAGLTWADLRWLKEMTTLPIILKGVIRFDDAQKAVEYGADAVWVSNHGGRQLDGGPSTLCALPEVVAGVDGRIPVLFDGGVRRGTDVMKALAIGASAVFVGRPIVHGLAVGGQAGVSKMLTLLNEELRTCMALSGCACLSDVTRDMVQLPGETPPRSAVITSKL